jgi:hypothetical protein
MKNKIKIKVNFVDGSLNEYEITSKELIHSIYSDDFGAPPTFLTIQGVDKAGNPIGVSFSYSDTNSISVEQ